MAGGMNLASKYATKIDERFARASQAMLALNNDYKFTGVKRGHLETKVVPHAKGLIGGILDVCEYGAHSCYIDQNSDLQDEIAEKIARVYNCGFEFMYNDGSEGVNVPQGIHVPNSQYRIWKKMDKKAKFMEGAAKGHFGWHLQSGANAFDVFPPEIFKEMIVRWPQWEAPIMRKDFILELRQNIVHQIPVVVAIAHH